MKILVTGVNGQLGHDVCKELVRRGFNDVLGIDKEDLDITDRAKVEELISNYKPDIIIHNAAWTAVDKAEDEKVACYAVNVLGTRYISECAQKLGSKLVYISTDYVFDGKGNKPFEVDSPTNPLSTYGKTKLEGELEAKKCDKHFILRTSWVFGINGGNFVKTMLRLAQTRDTLNVVNDQIGSPTYTVDLAKLICDMINTDKYGTYHATNEGLCSWYEFTNKIFEINNITHVKVNGIPTSEYPTKATRPLNSRLSKKSLVENGFGTLPTWQDALNRYKAELDYEKNMGSGE